MVRRRGLGLQVILVGLLVGVLALGSLFSVTQAGPARRLVVYSAAPLDFTETLKRDFEAANPGVTVDILAGLGAEAIISRLEAEKASPRADIMHSGALSAYIEAARRGLLATTVPREVAGVFPGTLFVGGSKVPLQDAQGRWYLFGMELGAIGYNRDRVAALRLPPPKTWSDLITPVYKGHVLFNMPQLSSSAFNTLVAHHQMMGMNGVWPFWDRLNENITFYTRSTSQVYALVARGEVPISFGVDRSYYVDRAKGAPVEVVYPTEGSWVFALTMGMVNGGPNADLAKAFMKFVLSPAGQVHVANQFAIPIRGGVKATAHNLDVSLDAMVRQVTKLTVIDNALAERVRAEIVRRFDGYTSGRAR
ncbi:MAG: ABC transporter substrate-binding protein [Armatimonadota bacterium]